VSRKNPLGKIKDVADVAVLTVVGTVTETVKHPIGTGQKVVGTAVGQAAAVVGAVTSRVAGGKSPTQPPTTPAAVPQDEPRKSQGDPVKPAAKKAPAKKAAAKKASAKPTPPPSDTEPLLDPAVTKEVKAEAEIGARASDVDKD
jgi:hypothetical protein